MFLDEHHQCPCRASHLSQFVGQIANGSGEIPQRVGHLRLHLGAQCRHKVDAFIAILSLTPGTSSLSVSLALGFSGYFSGSMSSMFISAIFTNFKFINNVDSLLSDCWNGHSLSISSAKVIRFFEV